MRRKNNGDEYKKKKKRATVSYTEWWNAAAICWLVPYLPCLFERDAKDPPLFVE